MLRDARARALRQRVPRGTRRSTFLLPGELRTMLDDAELPAAAALFALLAATGLQINEALGVTRGDLRLRRRLPLVQVPGVAGTATRHATPARSIPLVDPTVLERLHEQLVTAGRGQGARLWPVPRQTATKWLVQRLETLRAAGDPIADLPITLASFRTSFALNALAHQVPAPVVQRWLGLRRRESLARYERLLETTEDELMARMPRL